VLSSQLRQKQNQPDPMSFKPQLEEQRGEAVTHHFEAIMELVKFTRSQWEGVRERGVLELAQKEVEMQVRTSATG